MVARKIRRAVYTILAAAGVGLVLVALFLLSRTAQNSDDFDRLHAKMKKHSASVEAANRRKLAFPAERSDDEVIFNTLDVLFANYAVFLDKGPE